MRLKILTLLTLIALTYNLEVKAQFNDSVLGVGVMVGGSKLNGDIKNTNAGFTGGLLVRFSPNSNFSIGASTSFGTMTSGLDAIKTEIFNTSLFANYFIMPYSLFNPFVSLGFSKFHYWATDENSSLIRSSNGKVFMGWDSAIEFGIGVELAASRNWAVNTIGNYNYTRNDGLDGIVEGGNDSFFKGTIALVRYFDMGNKAANGRKPYSAKRPAREKLKVTQIEKPVPAPQTVSQPGKAGSKSFSNGISFEPGTATLMSSSTPQLDNIYNFLKANPNEQIELVGKSAGGKSANNKLLIDRAKAIKNYLVNKGIAPERIIINE